MRLNARQVFYEGGANTTILLGMEDITGQRALQREKEELLRQKDVLLQEYSIASPIACRSLPA